MGQVSVGLVKAVSCSDMWKYCCNAQHLKSRCCGEVCIEYDTDLIDVSDSETEIEIKGCCTAKTH